MTGEKGVPGIAGPRVRILNLLIYTICFLSAFQFSCLSSILSLSFKAVLRNCISCFISFKAVLEILISCLYLQGSFRNS